MFIDVLLNATFSHTYRQGRSQNFETGRALQLTNVYLFEIVDQYHMNVAPFANKNVKLNDTKVAN